MESDEYQIWDTDEIYKSSDRTLTYSSKRIDGLYRISIDDARSLRHELETRYGLRSVSCARVKAKLGTILIDKILQGEEEPLVNQELIDYLINRARPLPAVVRLHRLLRFLANPEFEVHISIDLISNEDFAEAAMGVSESIEDKELEYFVNYLVREGLLQDTTLEDFGYLVTIKGHELVEQIKEDSGSSEAFVAMWFDTETDRLWEVIEKAVRAAGYKPLRIDRQPHNNLIDDEIIAGIRRSPFVIADLTHGSDGLRGSVYYETGFARGLNKGVIQTARNDILEQNKVAFDLAHYAIITWTDSSLDLFETQLRYRIESVFGRGPILIDQS